MSADLKFVFIANVGDLHVYDLHQGGLLKIYKDIVGDPGDTWQPRRLEQIHCSKDSKYLFTASNFPGPHLCE